MIVFSVKFFVMVVAEIDEAIPVRYFSAPGAFRRADARGSKTLLTAGTYAGTFMMTLYSGNRTSIEIAI